MQPDRAKLILEWLMRIVGGMACLAIFAVVMPTGWMAAGSEAAGVDFTDSVLMQYLTRSVSLLYAMLGAMTVYLSLDVRRYRDLIRFIGWLTVGFGIGLTAIDAWAGMPAVWTLGEGPPTVVVGAAFVWLTGGERGQVSTLDRKTGPK